MQHLQRNVMPRWQRRVLFACLALLAMSGYALFYLISDEWRDRLGLVHAGVGALCAAVLPWHRHHLRH